MVEEPRPRKASGYYQPVSWHPWYISISDWLIRHPAGEIPSCAKDLGRSPATIRYIMNSDMFREFHAQRREEWRKAHDFAIISKVTQVAEKSLDIILDKFEKQSDKIPMKLVADIATASLDRLGYAPAAPPAASVNVNIDGRSQVIAAPVTAEALAEARDALRAAEAKRALQIEGCGVVAPQAEPEEDSEVVVPSIEEEDSGPTP